MAALKVSSLEVGAKLLNHALLEKDGQSIVEFGEDEGAGDAVGPGLISRRRSEQGQRGVRRLLSPLGLLIDRHVVEADLGEHVRVASDAVLLGGG